ncbi:hypothetical protein POTOM_052326 [Populus tomentosa]|uniref:Uncharacterized protein n=1 Tax=Populus tomentosa TaxID=118781 RepID=A0A8X7Y3Z3_POPTO|nr:hypothetical protein POTOM_052326 [Populus tomentosa]
MPLLLSNPLTSLSSLPPFSSPTLAFTATPVSRLDVKAFELKFKTWNGVRFQNPNRGNRIGAVIEGEDIVFCLVGLVTVCVRRE